MDCREARRTLWPADALRVSDDAVEEALNHAERCQHCSEFLEEDRRVARLIRERVGRVQAPTALRERLFTALARERAAEYADRATTRGRSVTALAAGILLALGVSVGAFGLWVASPWLPSETGATAFVEDYLRRVVEQETLATGSRDEVAAFFARELGVRMEPPEVANFELQRALVCLLNGRRGAVVEYRFGERELSYYTVPAQPGQRPAWAGESFDIERFPTNPMGDAALSSEKGVAVATWRDSQHHHALVANFGVEELEKLAPVFTSACPSARL